MQLDNSSFLVSVEYENSAEGFCDDASIVAYVENDLVGRLNIKQEDNLLYFFDLEIDREVQGRGIARIIILAALQKARELGLKGAYSCILIDNRESRRAHACCGGCLTEVEELGFSYIRAEFDVSGL